MDDETAPYPFSPALQDFHLKATSPCVDAGDFLTRTTAGGEGTAIPVADAGFFTDGFGIVEGDRIQLEGTSQPVHVVEIDHEANVIRVDRPVTWAAGQGVAQPFNGARPDIGAFER